AAADCGNFAGRPDPGQCARRSLSRRKAAPRGGVGKGSHGRRVSVQPPTRLRAPLAGDLDGVPNPAGNSGAQARYRRALRAARMSTQVPLLRYFLAAALLILIPPAKLHAQPALKKVRLGIQSSNIGFLPFHVAYHKGFYREQGIELETIFMATQAVNAAFVRGDLDYSAAVTASSRASCAA